MTFMQDKAKELIVCRSTSLLRGDILMTPDHTDLSIDAVVVVVVVIELPQTPKDDIRSAITTHGKLMS